MLNPGLYSSEHDDWNTPECVLKRVRRVADIGLDPCSNAQSIVRARTEYRLERGEDGLRLPWNGYGLVFVNPPYGDAISAFMRRVDHFGRMDVEIIALVPNRSDTTWFQTYAASARAKCEWRGRLVHPRGVADQRQQPLFQRVDDGPVTVVEEGGTAPFPSVVLYWGPSLGGFIDAFESAGALWMPA